MRPLPTLQLHPRRAVTTDAACGGGSKRYYVADLPLWTGRSSTRGLPLRRRRSPLTSSSRQRGSESNGQAKPKNNKNCASSYVPSHGIGLYWKPKSSLSAPRTVGRHSLSLSTSICVVERASPNTQDGFPRRRSPCLNTGTEALAGNQSDRQQPTGSTVAPRRAASDAWHLPETNNLLLVWVRLAVLGMAGGGRWSEGS